MDFRVLGQLTVRSGATVGQLTAPKPRQVLALALMRSNLIVPVSTFSAELWGDDPPASAQTTIQTYVLQVRRMLARTMGLSPAEIAKDVLATSADGYQFHIEQGQLDLHEFERLTVEGRSALGSRDYGAGSRLLSAALELWRGSALADVRIGPVLKVEVCRLKEERLAVCQQRIDAELRLDRHHVVLGDLSSLAAHHPLHEDLQAQYMIALCRAGRRTEALEAFHRLRITLLEDLGLEPSPRIHQLQHAILTAEADLDLMPFSVGEPAHR